MKHVLTKKSICRAVWHPSGEYFAVVAGFDEVLEVNLSGKVLNRFQAPRSVMSLSYNRSGTHLAVGCFAGTAEVLSTLSSQAFSLTTGHEVIVSVQLSEDGKRILLVSEMNTVELWDTIQQRKIHSFDCLESQTVWSKAFFAGEENIVVLGERSVWCFDAVSGKVIKRVELCQKGKAVMMYQPETHRVLAILDKKRIYTLDLNEPEPQKHLLLRSPVKVKHVLPTPSGALLLQQRKRAAIWDIQTNTETQHYPYGADHLRSLSVSPLGAVVVTGSRGVGIERGRA